MKNALNTVKNIIWAVAILVSLAALLVGLVFASVKRYGGERADGILILGTAPRRASKADKDAAADGMTGVGSTLRELPSTQDNGLEYVFNLSFLCDSTVSGLRSYSANAAPQLWSDSSGGLSASAAAEAEIEYGDGSMITPATAAMVARPSHLVIYLGGDGLANETEQSFIAGYTELINGILSISPETTVICCSLASVSSSYQSDDGLTAELIAQANGWIRQVCTDTGVYFADLASLFNGKDGYINDEFVSGDGRTLSSAGIEKMITYFRLHAV